MLLLLSIRGEIAFWDRWGVFAAVPRVANRERIGSPGFVLLPRVQNSPDSYVPSSSPESEADTEVSRYPDLSRVKLEPPSPCPSPPFPITPSACGKGEWAA